MKHLFITLLVLGAGLNSFAAKANKGTQYANATKMELDSKLPEPFARTQAAQMILDYDQHDATLVFLMSETEGIEVTFPITSDVTDNCNNRTIIATPPEGSTPYYKEFEIKVVDYSENTCGNIRPAAPTVATLKSYEVNHKSSTLSTLYADKLQIGKSEHH
ncbi:MAG: hypothetical protein ACXVCP_13415 [Bdellovibrio sp.]